MHKNRRLTLKKYQSILESRVNNLALLLVNKTTEETFIFKPKVNSMWHVNFMESYFLNRRQLLIKKFLESRCRMITLTYSTKFYTPEEVAKRHKADFKKFVRNIRKYYPDFQYAYFVEVTLNLYCHFHVYTDIFIPRNLIEKVWKEITGSYMIRIKEIKDQKQVEYCSNYHSVARKFKPYQLEFAFKHISRFFGQSRNFFDKEDKKESEFSMCCFLKDLGINWREYIGVWDRNETVLIGLRELNSNKDLIFFDVTIQQDQKFYLLGKHLFPGDSPPF